jgi:hypothetical protein
MGWVVEWTSSGWNDLGRRPLAEQQYVAQAVLRFAEHGDGCDVTEAGVPKQYTLTIGKYEVLVLFALGVELIDGDGDTSTHDMLYVLGVSRPTPSLRLIRP